jgi:tRNA pseudouridine38-40 synthase
MRNIKLVVEYDGADYFGFQRLPGRRTIQGELEKALSRIMQDEIKIVGAGRTDAGVHALGQVISFRTGCSIPIDKVCIALNSVMPRDITVKSAVEALPEFHARYSAKARTYRYTILNSETPSAILRRYSLWEMHSIDENAVRTGAEHLLGVHDFASFCSPDDETEHTVREIQQIEVSRLDELVFITLKGNAFLRNMVRIIVGVLIQVGIGRLNPGAVKDILNARDRRCAGRTASPAGLCLVNVDYSDDKIASGDGARTLLEN